MIFIDSNIPMYLVGAEHPNKQLAAHLLERCINQGERLVTDAEVYQEILHRYGAINRRAAVAPSFEVLAETIDEVFDIRMTDVLRAKDLLLSHEGLSARDCVHAAVMQSRRIETILTFDAGFDQVPGIRRLS